MPKKFTLPESGTDVLTVPANALVTGKKDGKDRLKLETWGGQLKREAGVMHKRTKKILFGAGFLLLLFPILVGAKSENVSMSPSKSQPEFVLSVHGDLISLKAENSSLKAVLEAIGQKMNIEVLGEIQEGETISAEFKQLPLAEALERLRPNYGYQIRTEKGEQKIYKIFDLPKPKGFVRPKPATKDPQHVEPAVSSELPVAERPDEPESGKKDDEPDKEKPPRPEPFKFEFDPAAFIEKGP